jgi:hypothetical protein
LAALELGDGDEIDRHAGHLPMELLVNQRSGAADRGAGSDRERGTRLIGADAPTSQPGCEV